MNLPNSSAFNKRFLTKENILLLATLLFLIKILYYHLRLIMYSLPTEYREGAMLISTGMISKGLNPYNFSSHPYSTNVYGVLYNYMVAPFALIFGNTLVIHKAISAVCAFFSSFVFYKILIKEQIKPMLAITAVTMFYFAILYSVTSLVRPDILGLLFMFLTIYIVTSGEYSWRSILLAPILTILCFYTKPYFIIGYLFIVFYLFLFVSKKKAISSFFFFLGLLTISVVVINHYYEAYLYDTIITNIDSTSKDYYHMYDQLVYFSRHSPGLLILLVYFVFQSFFSTSSRHLAQRSMNISFFNSNKGFFPSITISFWRYAFVLSLLVFIFLLGPHKGATMTYLYQLFFPFFLIVVFDKINRSNFNWITAFLLFISIVTIAWPYSWHKLNYKEEKDWTTIKKTIQNRDNILASPAVSPILLEMGKKVYDGGQEQFFVEAAHHDFPLFTSETAKARAVSNSYCNEIKESLLQKKFDLALLPNENSWLVESAWITENYIATDSVLLFMPHTNEEFKLLIWKPKK